MRRILNKWPILLAPVVLTFGVRSVGAVTLAELRGDKNLTPQGLIRRFAGFKFRLFDEVQPRDVFLASRTGDCDDFATLAADLLDERGYTTRLVAVYMERQTHVVCYVKEVGAYLDYNKRNDASPLVPSDGTLADIAGKVARSFGSRWSSVLEFTFRGGTRQPVASDFPRMAANGWSGGPQRDR
jgi:hypothetical protein